MPHISAVETLKIVVTVLAVLGTLRILAMQHQNSSLAQAFLLLY